MATNQTPPRTTPDLKKRPRGTPTLHTPTRPAKRVPLRQVAAQEHPVAQLSRSFVDRGTWDENECRALVEFIVLMSSGERWPAHKMMSFWERAGRFVQQRAKTRHLRTGESTVCC